MRKLILNEKTGFTSSMPFTIYDPNGIIFYSSDFTNKIATKRRLNFNVIAGNFTYNGNFVKLDFPVTMKNVILPPKERNIAYKRYEIIFADNPNKCTIYYDKGIIVFDNQFKIKPLYIKYLIYFHELGHHWYITESKADLYATKKLLELGFNPSQIECGMLESLSEKNVERQMKIVYTLTNNEG
jgi:hypothetical protein